MTRPWVINISCVKCLNIRSWSRRPGSKYTLKLLIDFCYSNIALLLRLRKELIQKANSNSNRSTHYNPRPSKEWLKGGHKGFMCQVSNHPEPENPANFSNFSSLLWYCQALVPILNSKINWAGGDTKMVTINSGSNTKDSPCHDFCHWAALGKLLQVAWIKESTY